MREMCLFLYHILHMKAFTKPLKSLRRGFAFVHEHPAKTLVQDAGLLSEARLLGRPGISGKKTLTNAAELRDCPRRPQAPQRGFGFEFGSRLGIGLRVGLGRHERLKSTTHLLHKGFFKRHHTPSAQSFF